MQQARSKQNLTVKIVEEGDSLKKYRTEIPNVVDDIGLSVYSFRLYCHIKRVVGAAGGMCYQSTSTLAKSCKMSTGQISISKKELIAVGLIRVEAGDRAKGETDLITIVDIWERNFTYFVEQKNKHTSSYNEDPSSHSEHTSSYSEMTSSQSERTSSYSETKNNSLKKELKEEEKQHEEIKIDTSLPLSVSSIAHTINPFSLQEGKEKTHTSTQNTSTQNTNKSTNKNQSDNRSKHPAIVAVREILGRFPNKLLWDEIIELIGETPDLEKLKHCAREWAKKTTNMGNLTWLFDWYKKGIPLSIYATNQVREAQANQSQAEKPIRGKAAFDIAAKRFLERKAREKEAMEAKQNGQHL